MFAGFQGFPGIPGLATNLRVSGFLERSKGRRCHAWLLVSGLPDRGVGFTMPVLAVVGLHGLTAILPSPCRRGKLLTHARHAHSSPGT